MKATIEAKVLVPVDTDEGVKLDVRKHSIEISTSRVLVTNSDLPRCVMVDMLEAELIDDGRLDEALQGENITASYINLSGRPSLSLSSSSALVIDEDKPTLRLIAFGVEYTEDGIVVESEPTTIVSILSSYAMYRRMGAKILECVAEEREMMLEMLSNILRKDGDDGE